MLRLSTFVLLCACLPFGNALAADDAPPFAGMAYNTKELSAIQYECEPDDDERIHCKFTQLAVRKKLTVGEVEKRRKDFEKSIQKVDWAKECAQLQEMFDIADGKRPPPEPFEWKDPRDKQGFDLVMKAMKEACANKDAEKFREVEEYNIKAELRTCRVSANNFEQTFRRVRDSRTKSVTWVVDAKPEGSCGIVQLSRFQPKVIHEITVWDYIARKAITNPSGEAINGVNCGDLDERSYEYSWNSNDGLSWADCDKVEFSPF